MRTIALLAMALLVAGCATTKTVVVEKNVMVEIPPDFLECSGVSYPDPDGLTDKQVARLLVRLDTALKECRGNVDAIRRLQERTRAVLEGRE